MSSCRSRPWPCRTRRCRTRPTPRTGATQKPGGAPVDPTRQPVGSDDRAIHVWHSVLMFLIWGWRSRSKVLSQGTFFCPHCGGDRQYAHKQARRWFTLFFLPVIPLKVLGEFVECQKIGRAHVCTP